ncbi:hypothetical protein KR52_11305 [Synechococcus sp. KORDI-52]|nr:hypothetical protein KR52_11305 [Synechococcus sp. KORDI-52]
MNAAVCLKRNLLMDVFVLANLLGASLKANSTSLVISTKSLHIAALSLISSIYLVDHPLISKKLQMQLQFNQSKVLMPWLMQSLIPQNIQKFSVIMGFHTSAHSPLQAECQCLILFELRLLRKILRVAIDLKGTTA